MLDNIVPKSTWVLANIKEIFFTIAPFTEKTFEVFKEIHSTVKRQFPSSSNVQNREWKDEELIQSPEIFLLHVSFIRSLSPFSSSKPILLWI